VLCVCGMTVHFSMHICRPTLSIENLLFTIKMVETIYKHIKMMSYENLNKQKLNKYIRDK